ncbi:hypothetical protein KP626_04460 [Christensenella sp. MSJ-20]|uniref:hypothetical protein n=1 Tax=Christensenella sp. MSJ-20 TaxID=2841518 RepID=UPI000D79C41C|nr:MAG: hypothetical protein DBY42_03390 [Bacillota bacterium]QWT56126.1 hypothetical protein KP626_04460 [Christensenella sp. MSJ-20]
MHQMQAQRPLALEEQRYLYVILSSTKTKIGYLIKKLSKTIYSHTSLSLDREMREMYSFARYYKSTPFYGGFIRETPARFSLGKPEPIYIKVFRLPVPRDQYESIQRRLHEMGEEPYLYNLFSAIFQSMGKGFDTEKAYTCSEFVARMLREENLAQIPMEEARCLPRDFETILAEYLYYEGDLWEYLGHVPENDDEFMTKLGYWRATKATLQLMGALIRRKASAHRQSRWTL